MPDGNERVYASSKEFGDQEWIQYKAPAGSVVVEDNSNGQILAMASYPTFDNRWMGNISGDKFDQLFGEKIDPDTGKADPDKSILVNRAVQGRYNLGSTIKPFVAWSAMHSGVIGPNEVYLDQGIYKLESIPEGHLRDRRALRVQERHQRAHATLVVVRAGHGRGRAGGQQRRVLLPARREVLMIDEHNASIDPR